MFKDESLKEAIKRISEKEISLPLTEDNSKIELFGVYDHTYQNNFENNDFGTRYIVFAHIIKVDREKIILECDEQHSDLKWFTIEDLLNNDQVHKFVKYYFAVSPENKLI